MLLVISVVEFGYSLVSIQIQSCPAMQVWAVPSTQARCMRVCVAAMVVVMMVLAVVVVMVAMMITMVAVVVTIVMAMSLCCCCCCCLRLRR